MPPYEGRNESTSTGSGAQAHTAGATGSAIPTPKPTPSETPGGASAFGGTSSRRVRFLRPKVTTKELGPTHTPGPSRAEPSRAEDKLYSFAFVVSTQLVGAYGDDLVLSTTQRD